MKKPEEFKVGKFTVKVGQYPDGFRFVIFGPDKKLFEKGVQETKECSIEAARDLISRHNRQLQKDRVNGVPTATEFAKALTAVNPSDGQWEMLKAHYNSPNRKITSSQLAEAAGYEHMYGANTQYGTLGHSLSDYLDFMPPGKYNNGDPLWITVLTMSDGQFFEEDTNHYQHELRKEVAAALEILGAT